MGACCARPEEDVTDIPLSEALSTKKSEHSQAKYLHYKVKAISGTAPPPLRAHSMVVHDTNLYVFGGVSNSQDLVDEHTNDNSVNVFGNDVVRFWIGSQRWEPILIRGLVPPARCAHSCVVFHGAMYVLGTELYDSADLFQLNLHSFHWRCVPATGDCPPAVAGHSAVVSGEHLVVFGGEVNLTTTNTIYFYHFPSHKWAQHVALPQDFEPQCRRDHTAVVYGSVMIVFGGFGRIEPVDETLVSFNVETKKWQKMRQSGDRPMPRGGHICQMYYNFMVVHGGMGCSGVVYNDVHVLHVETGMWRKLGTGPRLCFHACAMFDERIYIFGGNDGVNNTSDMNILPLKVAIGDIISASKDDPSFQLVQPTVQSIQSLRPAKELVTKPLVREYTPPLPVEDKGEDEDMLVPEVKERPQTVEQEITNITFEIREEPNVVEEPVVQNLPVEEETVLPPPPVQEPEPEEEKQPEVIAQPSFEVSRPPTAQPVILAPTLEFIWGGTETTEVVETSNQLAQPEGVAGADDAFKDEVVQDEEYGFDTGASHAANEPPQEPEKAPQDVPPVTEEEKEEGFDFGTSVGQNKAAYVAGAGTGGAFKFGGGMNDDDLEFMDEDLMEDDRRPENPNTTAPTDTEYQENQASEDTGFNFDQPENKEETHAPEDDGFGNIGQGEGTAPAEGYDETPQTEGNQLGQENTAQGDNDGFGDFGQQEKTAQGDNDGFGDLGQQEETAQGDNDGFAGDNDGFGEKAQPAGDNDGFGDFGQQETTAQGDNDGFSDFGQQETAQGDNDGFAGDNDGFGDFGQQETAQGDNDGFGDFGQQEETAQGDNDGFGDFGQQEETAPENNFGDFDFGGGDNNDFDFGGGGNDFDFGGGDAGFGDMDFGDGGAGGTDNAANIETAGNDFGDFDFGGGTTTQEGGAGGEWDNFDF